ncbi:MAG: hypothetical protein L0H93_20400 [Nocardioides sp.]|nr:hypothetical protein [Nocardioides sp.]
MTTRYYTDAYDPDLTALQLDARPASDIFEDYPTVVPARCSDCRRIWGMPAIARHHGSCWLCHPIGSTTCPPCRTRTEQGELW